MTSLVHQSPLGALEIPGVLGAPKPGEPFDVPFEQAVTLLDQHQLYQPAGGYEALTVPELQAVAQRRGVEPKTNKKADIIAALAADAEEAR